MEKKKKFILEFEKPLAVLEEQLANLMQTALEHNIDVSKEVRSLEETIEATKKNLYKNLTAWQRVQLSRHPQRPYALDYIETIFDDFLELHGDRLFQDDRALLGGIARLGNDSVMIIAEQKGRNTKENLMRNFGSPNPEGYRKALRLMKMAEKFNLPIISLVDTPGAYPGIGAEERHVAEAIAVNIRDMSALKTPIIAVIIGEGGSGGALGIAVADSVFIFENAYYSVISPEGCASILWKDRAFSPDASEALKLSADHLLEYKIVDKVLKEPLGGAQNNPEEAAKTLKKALLEELKLLKSKNTDELLERRYQKYRAMGSFETAELV
ncbi:MAG: acetyl-CoA carboxylase carboxyl transferase subunit alpha [Verrucomicrobia bacterium]|nr:MAG: acetyl-CoA carboxylase carboxyl transferase subunit alpha [Verrucomicrobiota bacterium]